MHYCIDYQGGWDYITGLVLTSSEATGSLSPSPQIVSRDSFSLWIRACIQIARNKAYFNGCPLCRGLSWRVRLAKQETLTPPGYLVSSLVCRGPLMSTVVLYCWCHGDGASVLLYFTLYIFDILLYYNICLCTTFFYYLSAMVGCWSSVSIRRIIYKFLNMCPFDYTAVAVSEKRWALVNQFNHTCWVAVVSPTDRLRPVRNRCVSEFFGGVFVLSSCILIFLVGEGAFVIWLSQISSFSSKLSIDAGDF